MCVYLKDYELIDYIFDKCIDEKFILLKLNFDSNIMNYI
jgi:hypothetical protein